jgi:hypothetical protein
MSSVEIEDVLSSIRRLVSEDLRPSASRPAPAAAAPGPDKLILTPALRVVAEDAPAPLGQMVAGLGAAVDAYAEPWESETGDAGPMDGPEAAGVLAGAAPARTRLHLAEAMRADLPGDAADAAPAPMADLTGEGAAEEAVAEVVGLARPVTAPDEPQPTDAAPDEGGLPAAQDDAGPSIADRLADVLAEEILALSDTVAPEVPAAEVLAPDVLDPDTLSPDALLPDALPAGPAAGEPARVPGWAQEGEDDEAAATLATAAPTLEPDPDWADAAEAEALEELSDEGTAEPAAAYAAPMAGDEPLPLDDEALRDLVRELIVQELQGPLGERITRNIRKLVRAEIARALASDDLL